MKQLLNLNKQETDFSSDQQENVSEDQFIENNKDSFLRQDESDFKQSNSQRWKLLALVSAGIILVAGSLAIYFFHHPSLLTISNLSNFNSSSKTSRENRDTDINIISVKTQRMEPVKSYQITQTYTGQVAALRTSELSFEQQGKVVWVNVDRGNRISINTVVAKIDTSNLEAKRQELIARKAQAKAILNELKAGARSETIAAAIAQVRDLKEQLKLIEIKRERRRFLYKEGAISQEMYDEMIYNASALEQRIANAKSNLAELENGTRKEQIVAQQAAVKQLEASISDLEITIAKSKIKAPFASIVAKRHIDEGTVVAAGQPVVRLIEDAKPEIEIGVPIQVINQVPAGSRQQVQIGNKIYTSRVKTILPYVNETTRTRTVILSLENADMQSIAPGQLARLIVQQTVPTNGFWLPVTALVRGERGLWSAYTLAKTGATEEQGRQKGNTSSTPYSPSTYRVKRADVEVLRTETNRVLVRGVLRPDDRVIVNGTHLVVPGQLVRSVETQS
jgi:multidrug efflux pump subunit AcrA (membrane-fusion protein)